MGIKKYKPTTPGTRFKTVLTGEEITAKEPYKPLLRGKRRISGRAGSGSIAVRRRGGGSKRAYRIIDFRRDKNGIEARVATIEYDPNRSARIALLHYRDGEKRYILAPDGLKVGDMVVSGENVKATVGNALHLKSIPVGTVIHNIELQRGKGGQICRSAGTSAVVMAREGNYCSIRLPSGEIRKVHQECYATVGQVGNLDHMNVSLGKAGCSRWLGRRPKVRGVAMNPVDHPLGGGEGKSSGGRHPCTPWGKPAKGFKTRKKRKPSNKMIVKRRR